jgi:hypothetical protein
MRRIISALLLLLVPVMLISADRDAGTYSIGGYGGLAMPQGPKGFKDLFNNGIGFGGEFKYNINPTTSLGLSFTYLSFKADKGKFEDMYSGMMFKPSASTLTLEIDPTTVNVISANLIKYLTPPESSTGFFITLGGGYYMSKSPDVKYSFSDPVLGSFSDTIKGESDNDFGINGGVGLEFKIGEKATLFVVGEYHYVFSDDKTDNSDGLVKASADSGDDFSGKTKVISIMGGIRFALGQ